MYTSREFWKTCAIDNPDPVIAKEVYDDHILIYNKTRKKEISLNFLDFSSIDEFKSRLKEINQRAVSLEIQNINVVLRSSDSIILDDEYMEKLGFTKMVELSKCGTTITQAIIESLSKSPLPDGYELHQFDIEEVLKTEGIHHLVNNNFPDGMVSTTEEVIQMLEQGHTKASQNDEVPIYSVVTYRNDVVGFGYGTYFQIGPKKNMLHLTVGVTHSDHRGKGLYKSLLLGRVQAAKNYGANFVYTEADITTSRPILERLGLEEFERMRVFTIKVEKEST